MKPNSTPYIYSHTKTERNERYFNMVQHFVETGQTSEAEWQKTDAMACYLVQCMINADIQQLVLSNKVGARIFSDTMHQFITLYTEKSNYRMQRSAAEIDRLHEAEHWSLAKRSDQWMSLLQQLESDYGNMGFRRDFYDREFGKFGHYTDTKHWQCLVDDWRYHLNYRNELQCRQFVSERHDVQQRLLLTNLKASLAYMKANGIFEDEFLQTWSLMGGRWNSLEFERLRKVAKLQRKYTVIAEVTHKMGRHSNPEGTQHLSINGGRNGLIARSSHSDIAGIGLGNDLNALLPHEKALYLDPQLEDLFLQKYVTQRLQTFDYRSKMLRNARSLHTQTARRKGPMVVCVDRSGSMAGDPERIALSLMMQLTEMCYQEKRACYLIAFSVNARPIEIMRNRTLLLRFFAEKSTGRTDARHMLETMLSLLHSDTQYIGADVLWVTDFRIPLPSTDLLHEMDKLRADSTRFYGLQIGIAENRWIQWFDEIFSITDVKMPIA